MTSLDDLRGRPRDQVEDILIDYLAEGCPLCTTAPDSLYNTCEILRQFTPCDSDCDPQDPHCIRHGEWKTLVGVICGEGVKPPAWDDINGLEEGLRKWREAGYCGD